MIEIDMKEVRDLFKRIDKALKDGFRPSQIARALLVGARVIRDEVQRVAPVRKRAGKNKKGKLRPGALKRSIQAQALKDRPGMPAAARVRMRAPHGHLVEYGTGPRFRGMTKDRKTGAWEGTGKRFGYTGFMPASLFFEQAAERKMPEAYMKISEAIDVLYQKTMKKWRVA